MRENRLTSLHLQNHSPLNTMEAITPQALESLDQNSRQEIIQFMEAERSKAKIQETVHTFTNLCWNKCIKKINSAQLDGSEQQCEY